MEIWMLYLYITLCATNIYVVGTWFWYLILQINNPDMRVKIIKEFVMESFPAKPLLNYALEVEKITTSKKPNLILNVDGIIAVSFVDLLRHSGSFTRYVAFWRMNSCASPSLASNLYGGYGFKRYLWSLPILSLNATILTGVSAKGFLKARSTGLGKWVTGSVNFGNRIKILLLIR